MGLDTTHGCWHGSYTSFDRFRSALARAAGIDLDAMRGFGGRIEWSSIAPDPLHELLNHSDCEDSIPAIACLPLALRLEDLLPELAKIDSAEGNTPGQSRCHVEDAQDFAKGLRLAADCGEDVEFH